MRGTSAASVGRTLRAVLILAALLLRFMVPAGYMVGSLARGSINRKLGYMVGTAASGAPALVVCPGFEVPLHPMAMQGRSHAPRHDPAKHREAPCPFAALAAPALPPAPPAFAPPPAPRAEPLALQPLIPPVAPALAAPPPTATGPPADA